MQRLEAPYLLFRHIRWQEVIELDNTMNTRNRLSVEQSLNKLEASQTGQKLFSELYLQQSMLPEAHRFNIPLAEPSSIRGIIATAIAPSTIRQLNALSNTRENHRKTYIVLNDNASDSVEAYLAHNMISMDTTPNLQSNVPIKAATSEKTQAIATPADVTLAHELQHIIDSLSQVNFPFIEKYTRGCLEERAVAAGNQLLKEKYPAFGVRYSYSDISLPKSIGTIEGAELALHAFLQKNLGITTPTAHEFMENVKQLTEINAGCNSHTSRDIRQETANQIKKFGFNLPEQQPHHGINIGTIKPPPKNHDR